MIYTVFIPLGLLVVPWLLVRYVFATADTKQLAYRDHAAYLFVASAFWVASQLLPNVPISAQTDTFTMHFTGGVVAAVLFLYTLKAYKLTFQYTWQLWIGLFLFVSAMGVLNELFEFFADQTGIIPIPAGTTPTDTWWDLTANTLGGFLTVALVRIGLGLRRKS